MNWKKILLSIKYGDQMQLNSDDLVMKLMKEFDIDRNDMIDEVEFIDGMTRWLDEAIRVSKCKDKKKAIDEYDKVTISNICTNTFILTNIYI